MRKAIIIIGLFIYQISTACSAFFFTGDRTILAKNFDWSSGQGYIIKNNRGEKKFAYGFRDANVAGWTSKFGSITFNQIGKEFPYGGMNEKGLVVEQLWLSNSEYQDNQNKAISELEWIQYQLDNFSNVDEVIANINGLTIKPNALIHYILADKNGVSAVIEFVNGKVVITRQNAKSQVITNGTSHDSTKYFEANNAIDPASRDKYDRYCILRKNLNVNNLSIAESFEKLILVSEDQPNYKTYWSIVYDIKNLKIHFKSFSNNNIKTIALSDFNFDTASKVQFSQLNSTEANFITYTNEDNKLLLIEAMKMMDLQIDIEQANQHQMSPIQIVSDAIYQKNYADLTINFVTKKPKGNIYFVFTQGAENYKNYAGFRRGIIPVSANKTRRIFYGVPKIEFAIACFHDTNGDNKMDKNFLGIPTNTGFSNNKKKLFGIPPNYENAKINLDENKTVEIVIN